MTVVAADLVRQARLSRQLTMSALADLAGVPKSTVSRIEAGKIDPTVTMLSRIARAAGFRLVPELAEESTDEPFAAILARLDDAAPDERGRLLSRFPAVAATAPVAQRAGARRAEVPGDISRVVDLLTVQGQEPVVSATEAVMDSVESTRSFFPIVYVNDPQTVTGFAQASRSSYQVMLLLPTTANVRAVTRDVGGITMVSHEWAVLDTLASPGRQADLGLDMLALLDMVAA